MIVDELLSGLLELKALAVNDMNEVLVANRSNLMASMVQSMNGRRR